MTTYDSNNIFAKILRHEIPADVVYEDERCLAFRDVAPQAPTHVLVIPKAEIARLGDASAAQKDILGHLMWAAGEVARIEKLDDFRIAINHGAGAGQTVFHLHVHVLGGRDLAWPPG